MDDRTLVPVKLEGGSTLYVDARGAEVEGILGLGDGLPFAHARKAIIELGNELEKVLREISPDKATAELDLDLTVKGGFLTPIIGGATGEATIKITLEWDKAPPASSGGAALS